MDEFLIPRTEYPSFYGGYVEKSGGMGTKEGLVQNFHRTHSFFRKIPKNKWDYRYEKGKWSIKEIVLHLIDSERVFAYRALMIARSEQPILQSFDQDEFVLNSQASNRTPNDLISEFYTLRKSTIVQFSNYNNQTLAKTGTINGGVISVRALGAIIHGHAEHHLTILKQRYL